MLTINFIFICLTNCPKPFFSFPALYANPRFNLTTVIDAHLPAAQSLATKFGVKDSFSSLAEAFTKDPLLASNTAGIVISSPTFTHPELFQLAAENKISIFTEKPVAATGMEGKKYKSNPRLLYSRGDSSCCDGRE